MKKLLAMLIAAAFTVSTGVALAQGSKDAPKKEAAKADAKKDAAKKGDAKKDAPKK